MSRYKVIIKEEAQEDLKKLLHSEPKIYKKANFFSKMNCFKKKIIF